MPNTTYNVNYYLIAPSWCGSTNIPRCVEMKHLYQCQIHPIHYSRKPGKCIECLEEWDRREREADRLWKMEMKAKDAEFTKTRKSQFAETLTKPGKIRQTQVPKVVNVAKPGRWPKPSKREEQSPEAEKVPELELELEQDRDDGQERGKNKGKTHGLTLYRAKKKWRD